MFTCGDCWDDPCTCADHKKAQRAAKAERDRIAKAVFPDRDEGGAVRWWPRGDAGWNLSKSGLLARLTHKSLESWRLARGPWTRIDLTALAALAVEEEQE